MIQAGTMIRNSKSKSEGKLLPLVEEFFSIQGEGFHSGKAAWFIRLGGCDVGCNWCDTKFAWDPELHPLISADVILENALNSGADSVVITGGEPLMWNLDYLCSGFKKNNISTFLETSGTFELSGHWDWICLSPKMSMPPGEDICRTADELKVIIEKPEDLKWAEDCRLRVSNNCRLFLQPEWSSFNSVISSVVSYILKNPQWRVSLQIHKYMHIP